MELRRGHRKETETEPRTRRPRRPVPPAGGSRDWGVAKKDRSRLPLTSYHRHSPLGALLERFNWSQREWTWPDNTSHADARLPANVIGLCLGDGTIPLSPCSACWTEPPIAVAGVMGPGSAAAYARPYQFVDFYEPSPAVIDLSFPPDSGPPTFTFARDALARGAVVRVFRGPPRKSLEDRAPRGFYRFVVIEPFRLKGTPELDLVSAEALTLYAHLTREDAVFCFQSPYVTYDLPAAIAETAQSRGFTSHLGCYDLRGSDMRQTTSDFVSHWVLVARSRESLLPLLKEPTFFDDKRPTSYREKQQQMMRAVLREGCNRDPAGAQALNPW